ncbi:MAG: dehydrogenase [Spirochaetae bacterium HGW-Spirochaetae-5]|nr:MAG: dehydrogenase [Spirochaetae bacterium HGW-Spirochaetae-5]
MGKKEDYTIQTFPSSRIFTGDIGQLGLQKHHVKALLEIDVTEAREKIKSKKSDGDKISFTSWIIKCIGQAIFEHKQIHSLKKGRRRLIIFDDVDITIVVEKDVNGTPVPLPLVIREVNNKDIHKIYNEIESAKNQLIDNENNYVLKEKKNNFFLDMFLMLPQFIRLTIWKIVLLNPFRVKKMMGTAIVTSLGMTGNVNGWIIPYSIHPVCFAIGSITEKPAIINQQIETRKFLQMTTLIDHDVIDGAPAARFVSRLQELIMNCYNL